MVLGFLTKDLQSKIEVGKLYRVYDENEKFIGLGKADIKGLKLKNYLLFRGIVW